MNKLLVICLLLAGIVAAFGEDINYHFFMNDMEQHQHRKEEIIKDMRSVTEQISEWRRNLEKSAEKLKSIDGLVEDESFNTWEMHKNEIEIFEQIHDLEQIK